MRIGTDGFEKSRPLFLCGHRRAGHFSFPAGQLTEGRQPYRETPEEQVCHMETLDELLSVLESCTEAQRRRFLLYALDGLSYEQIGQLCGCSKNAAFQSVEAVRKKFKKLLGKYMDDMPFSV